MNDCRCRRCRLDRDEGARWAAVETGSGDRVWILFTAARRLGGMMFHGGPLLEWCAHVVQSGSTHTGLARADAAAIVEQSAGFIA